MKIGFIGLGVMGAPMAGHLLAAGHEVHTSVNRTAPSPELVSKGLIVNHSPAEVAEHCDVVILMLPVTSDVDRVCFGKNGLSERLRAGSLVIDMSSIDPAATEDFARKVEDLGSAYLDAPVSGGEVGAKAATLSIMVGGPAQAFGRALPLFETMGKNITHVGDKNGAGQTCKIANQIIVALTIEAVGEALTLATRSGVDPAKVRKALLGGFASSRILEVHGERMISRSFAPGFRIALHSKDLDLALKAAAGVGVCLPSTALCQQLFNSNKAADEWNEDHSAVVKSIERLAGVGSS
ncbi:MULTISPECIES: 2-hydroxy-3-oxopropionate reductase [unclassified Mesorhizobium]|uniref:2-hydroxy-3-oxopropionate reductase n=1 Tax=unclassified Mesorhizobium TaxID=325217 RepID=UPI0024158987|nr:MULTISPECIES: 2-hydroxy-3-oxopropionate reductase [unclassified Mesorhizobium]MDG4889951.1 2-hydroxy-3-oxopropionate reductase [Mesorhizobium sp. WSM4887]MDG4904094.1 2-hydroxy-3-oxopropionate reductase [Mesorhizobium sp. WSM4962]MDG4909121.1 2-hydroxy-3-oxopropionate reductase [Mesorhizobium sp. WSM4898]MDG4921745.1 2-hydroxy-3-oxopropionate reductase [Mesorhizobium sp. WSM4989]